MSFAINAKLIRNALERKQINKLHQYLNRHHVKNFLLVRLKATVLAIGP